MRSHGMSSRRAIVEWVMPLAPPWAVASKKDEARRNGTEGPRGAERSGAVLMESDADLLGAPQTWPPVRLRKVKGEKGQTDSVVPVHADAAGLFGTSGCTGVRCPSARSCV